MSLLRGHIACTNVKGLTCQSCDNMHAFYKFNNALTCVSALYTVLSVHTYVRVYIIIYNIICHTNTKLDESSASLQAERRPQCH